MWKGGDTHTHTHTDSPQQHPLTLQQTHLQALKLSCNWNATVVCGLRRNDAVHCTVHWGFKIVKLKPLKKVQVTQITKSIFTHLPLVVRSHGDIHLWDFYLHPYTIEVNGVLFSQCRKWHFKHSRANYLSIISISMTVDNPQTLRWTLFMANHFPPTK